MPTLTDRLLHGLLAIHATPPRLIATPSTLHSLNSGGTSSHPPTPGASTSRGGMGAAAKRRASVAIIIRIRPTETPSPSPSPSGSDGLGTPAHGSTPAEQPSVPTDYVSAPGSLPPSVSSPAAEDVPESLRAFFALPWVRTGVPELLFIKRAKRQSDRWSSHVAFPGGRSEPDDEDGHFTALRETWEEVSLDLAEKEWLGIGGLDEREITTSLGRRLLMILSPFVFLCTSPHAPAMDLQPNEVASAHWIPLEMLTGGERTRWGDVKVDIASRLAPRSPTIRWALRVLVGSMHFQCVLLPDRPDAVGLPEEEMEQMGIGKIGAGDLRLWGLTLGMTLDLIAFMSAHPAIQHPSPATYPFFTTDSTPASAVSKPSSRRRGSEVSSTPSSPTSTRARLRLEDLNALSDTTKAYAPSMTSIFPRFTYPDINLLVWLFGRRYRRIVQLWNDRRPPPADSSSGPSTPFGGQDRRVSWAGVALGQFYTAVRKALIVAIAIRAAAVVGGTSWFVWWVSKRLREANARRRAVGL